MKASKYIRTSLTHRMIEGRSWDGLIHSTGGAIEETFEQALAQDRDHWERPKLHSWSGCSVGSPTARRQQTAFHDACRLGTACGTRAQHNQHLTALRARQTWHFTVLMHGGRISISEPSQSCRHSFPFQQLLHADSASPLHPCCHFFSASSLTHFFV